MILYLQAVSTHKDINFSQNVYFALIHFRNSVIQGELTTSLSQLTFFVVDCFTSTVISFSFGQNSDEVKATNKSFCSYND